MNEVAAAGCGVIGIRFARKARRLRSLRRFEESARGSIEKVDI
jgi:hypothetical protein